jgi:putative ABC transport system permease protein
VLKNYLKIAWRNIKNAKGYSFLKIAGLTVGLAVCLLILLFVQDEISFDTYHTHAGRIYRIQRGYFDSNGAAVGGFCTLAPSWVPVLQGEFKEIEKIARMYGPGNVILKVDDTSFAEERFFFAEPDIFDILSIPLLQGDPKTVLNEKGSLILSQSMARKYFGDEDPMGRSLTADGRLPLQVTGIMTDIPPNSHLHFDFLASYITLKGLYGSGDGDYFHGTQNFSDNVTLVYARLAPGVDAETMETKIPSFVDLRFPTREDDQGRLVKPSQQIYLQFQKVKGIHLFSHTRNEFEPNSDMKYVVLFTIIAFFILAIACINFMNLATARAVKRAKEVGLRKVAGADRRILSVQFLGESMLISLISLILSLALVALFLPLFAGFTGHALKFAMLLTPRALLVLLGVFGLTGLAAGLYPSLYLSSFQPAVILRGDLTRGSGRAALRKALVVFQFAISIALIFCVTVISRQMSYMRNADLGFKRDNIILIPAGREVVSRWEGVKTGLLQNKDILAATLSKRAPSGRLLDAPGFEAEVYGQQVRNVFFMPHNRVEHDFFKTYGMEIVAGRDFSQEYPTDAQEAFVLNELAVRRLGFKSPQDAVGAPMKVFAPDKQGRIIGVVRDFNYESMHRPIVPIVTYIAPNQANTLSLCIAPGSLKRVIEHVNGIFEQVNPGAQVKYNFLNDRLAALYRNEERMMDMFSWFSLLAIFIGCLGLVGLAAFSAELRTKEIGVRKVLGASAPNIFLILSKEFSKWVLAANLIAWPLAYFAMNKWLGNFAYRTTIGIAPFTASSILAFLIAFFTVSFQAGRAAVSDPVKSLRYE